MFAFCKCKKDVPKWRRQLSQCVQARLEERFCFCLHTNLEKDVPAVSARSCSPCTQRLFDAWPHVTSLCLPQVDMPVFFYIDPEYAADPLLENSNEITLSYTFFEAKEGLQLPMPTIR